MGYSAHLTYSEFAMVEGANKHNAYLAIRALADTGQKYMWVERSDLVEARTLEEIVDAWGWKLKVDYETTAVVGIRFDAGDGKLGDEDVLFAALAPFVKPGSFIEMSGEDGDRWRWVFDGTSVKRVEPRIVWTD